jgi:hypothetical protein
MGVEEATDQDPLNWLPRAKNESQSGIHDKTNQLLLLKLVLALPELQRYCQTVGQFVLVWVVLMQIGVSLQVILMGISEPSIFETSNRGGERMLDMEYAV